MFDIEYRHFQEAFSGYKDKKIVLYGIGRRTAALVSHNNDFNFVGLMDRDSSCLGKKMYGLTVVSLEQAEQIGDIIVINAPRTYWKIIYRRISNSAIPIYYYNGEAAITEIQNVHEEIPYWNENWEEFEKKLNDYEVILVDFFDVLVSEKILNWEDVDGLVNARLHNEGILNDACNFTNMKNQTIKSLDSTFYTMDDLYRRMQELYLLSGQVVAQIKSVEIETKKSLIVPRYKMIEMFNKLQTEGRKVYIVSWMILSKEIVNEILKEYGVQISLNQIIISADVGLNKTGVEFYNSILKKWLSGGRGIYVTARDLGVELLPTGFDVFRMMSTKEMLQNSSIRHICNEIIDPKESLVIGAIISELFNDPFTLNKNKGKVFFESGFQWGYCVWGNIIFTFIEWLVAKSIECGVKRILFLARDGYLLKEDFEFYLEENRNQNFLLSDYVYTSRRIAYAASISDKSEFVEWCSFPYNGTFGDYLKDRFTVCVKENDINAEEYIQLPNDIDKVIPWMQEYLKDIIKELYVEKHNYLTYLEHLYIKEGDVFVDTGYYGNIQDKLNKILGKNIAGFYFTCFLDETNICAKRNVMIPCFQAVDDYCAKKSKLREKTQLVESMFTAPYGMIIKVDENGKKICSPAGANQVFFSERLKINEGIKKFIKDMLAVKKVFLIDGFMDKGVFSDEICGIILDNSELIEEICSKFVWDDILVQKRENPIFM